MTKNTFLLSQLMGQQRFRITKFKRKFTMKKDSVNDKVVRFECVSVISEKKSALHRLVFVCLYLLIFATTDAMARTGTVIVTGTAPTDCNLVDAVLASNSNASVRNCTFSTPGNSTFSNVIAFRPNMNFVFTERYLNDSAALPVITNSVQFWGRNNIIERSDVRGNEFRLMQIEGEGTRVTLFRIIIKNGRSSSGGGIFVGQGVKLIVNEGKVMENRAEFEGGGIYLSDNSELFLTRSLVMNNRAENNGGGIFADNSANVSIVESSISDNEAWSRSGGGIYSIDSRLTIEHSKIENNIADFNGGGIHFEASEQNDKSFIIQDRRDIEQTSEIVGNIASGGSGGGIFIEGDLASGFFYGVSVRENLAGNNGGGVAIRDGKQVIIGLRSGVESNRAFGSGGGVSALRGDLFLSNSTVSDNTARDYGGGIYTEGYPMVPPAFPEVNGSKTQVLGSRSRISTSTISSNQAIDGGGFYGENSNFSINTSTLSGNRATYDGAAISINGQSWLEFRHSTVAKNRASTSGGSIYSSLYSEISLKNSVVANSFGKSCSLDGGYPSLNSTYSWFQDSSCNGFANGNPKLSNLRHNGGPTLTHAPLPGSPLAGAARSCSFRDQRGELRGEESCFIGAVEGFANISALITPIISLFLLDDE